MRMATEEYCDNCEEDTETHYKQVTTGYVIHRCVSCGADKKDDPLAPV